MKETLESIQKLISSWRDTATSYKHRGEYITEHCIYICANELEMIIKTTQPLPDEDGQCPHFIYDCYCGLEDGIIEQPHNQQINSIKDLSPTIAFNDGMDD